MPAYSELLQAGEEALKQRRFAYAVRALEAFCQQAPSRSKDYYQAQMWLVQAYQENGQSDQAIALCQQMASSEIPQVKAWAERTLPLLDSQPGAVPQATVSEAPNQTETRSQPESAPNMEEPTAAERLTPEQATELYTAGNKALKMQKFTEAVEALEAYCRGTDPSSGDYAQAQMWLVKAYKGNGQEQAAISLCQKLTNHEKEYVSTWAKLYLSTLDPVEAVQESSVASESSTSANDSGQSPSVVGVPDSGSFSQEPPKAIPKGGRFYKQGVTLTMKGVAASLSLASGVTLSLLFGMVLVLCLSLILIYGSDDPLQGFILSVVITVVLSLLTFFISPFIMDLVQGWLYGTRWVSLSEVERYSPETAQVIQTVCQQKKLHIPRLGIIEDNNPTAFTYGSLPNSARLVVSRGLFTYLDDDEIATVYAHELGHIVHWDFAVMTLASTLVQIAYLLYTYINRLARSVNNKKIRESARSAAIMAYIFYIVGEYLLLYLSRTREYYADHFAAEVTGNPNGLSRALVKIAYGILEEGKRNPEPSKLVQGTRALGIADPKSAVFTGTAYRVASEPQKVGRVFLWDMFNPWAWWMELNSTHPLTGKRVRALSTYAEQLGLDAEFDMSRVMREGRSLNKQKLYSGFAVDVVMLWADWLGLGIGFLLGIAMVMVQPSNFLPPITASLLGFGLGTLLKMFFMYPDFNRAPETDVLALMSDPYASPLRGRPVQLSGEIIGRGDSGYRFGSDLKLQDSVGTIYVRYSSRFGPLGNFLFGMSQAEGFINQQVSVIGWFRRGIMPWVDLVRMDCDRKWTVNSYHRFWLLVRGFACIALGFLLPILF
jgi:Zn-dependent protease with chaperone function/DNA-binding SARP family transcriptional activator